jgi:hypothetical protein
MSEEQAVSIAELLGKIKAALTSALNYLNLLGSVVFAYALANPSAATELVMLLPESLRPYAPVAAVGWFIVVQIAKMRAIKKAVAA